MTIINRLLISACFSLCIASAGFSASGGEDFSEEFKRNLRRGFSNMSLAPGGSAKEAKSTAVSSSKGKIGSPGTVAEEKASLDAKKKFCNPLVEIELDPSGIFFPLVFPGLPTHTEDGLFAIRAVKSPLIKKEEDADPYQNFRLRRPNWDTDWSYLGEKDPTFLDALRRGRIAPLLFQVFMGSEWSEGSHLGHILLYVGRVNDQCKNWFGLIREFEIASTTLVAEDSEKRVLSAEEERNLKTLPTGMQTMAMNLLIKVFQDTAMKRDNFPLLTTLFVNIPLVEGETTHPLLGDKAFGMVFSADEAGGRDKGLIAFNHSHFAGRESELTLFLSAGFNLTRDFPEVPSIKEFLPAGGIALGSVLSDLRMQQMVIVNGDYYGPPLRFEGWETKKDDGTSSRHIELVTGTKNQALQEKVRQFLATRKS